jgi:hypothetical protein
MTDISRTEAALALETVQRRRQDVVSALDVPRWYWPGMAAGWAVLGTLADYGPVWASTAATLAFGAAHASIARQSMSGRHASARVSISRDLVSRWVPTAIVAFLAVMVLLTVAVALVLDGDGARHPAALAGGFVALVVLAAGPHLMHAARHVALRRQPV